MRALTMGEVLFVSGGVVTDGNGMPVQDNQGWNNYRDPIRGTNKDPLLGFSFAKLGESLENPLTTIGKAVDAALKAQADAYYNATVYAVNRDRNGDGNVTDSERQKNWNDMGGQPFMPPVVIKSPFGN
jgi:hypothetical protein